VQSLPLNAPAKSNPDFISTVTGWPFGAINTNELPSRLTRLPPTRRPCSSRKSIHFRSAEANTSAGAPESICLASADDAPKETLGKGWPALCHLTDISVNALVKLAAAKTRTCSSAWTLADIANKMIEATREIDLNIGAAPGSWKTSYNRNIVSYIP